MDTFLNNEGKKLFIAIPWFIAGLYALGFFIWNFYLSLFGFFEDNFLQTRFLSTGFFAALAIFGFMSVIFSICTFFRCGWGWFKKQHLFYRSFIVIFLLGLEAIVYTLFLFPWLPQFFGGARPVIISLLGTADQIRYVGNFNLKAAQNADRPSVQTLPTCLLYQNANYILLGIQYSSGQDKDIFFRNVLLKAVQFVGIQYGLGSGLRCRPWDFFIPLNNLQGKEVVDLNPESMVKSEIICK